VSEVLFGGLRRQNEINRLLDELFGGPDGASPDEAEGVVLTLYEEGERENADQAVLLTA
jgi:hypothetical protein